MEDFGQTWLLNNGENEFSDEDEETLSLEIEREIANWVLPNRKKDLKLETLLKEQEEKRELYKKKLNERYANQVTQIVKQLVETREEFFGEVHPHTLQAKILLSNIFLRMKKLDMAEDLIVEALTAWKTLQQRCNDDNNLPSHCITLGSLNNIVLLSQKIKLQERRRAVFELNKIALSEGSVNWNEMKEDEDTYAQQYDMLTAQEEAQGRIREKFRDLTEEEIQEVMYSQSKQYVQENFEFWPFFANCMKLYYEILVMQGKIVQGMKLVEQALMMMNTNKQQHSLSFLLILRTLSEVFERTGEYTKSEASYDYLISNYEKIKFPADSDAPIEVDPIVEYVKILSDAAKNKCNLQKFEDAIGLIDKAVNMLDESFGKYSFPSIEIQSRFLQVYLEMGKADTFESKLNDLLMQARVCDQWMEEQEGPNEEELAEMPSMLLHVLNMALEYYIDSGSQHNQRLVSLLEEAIIILEDKKDHQKYVQEYVEKLFMLLNEYDNVHESDKALDLIQNSVTFFKIRFGDPSSEYLQLISYRCSFLYSKYFKVSDKRDKAIRLNEELLSQSKFFANQLRKATKKNRNHDQLQNTKDLDKQKEVNDLNIDIYEELDRKNASISFRLALN